MNQKALSFDEAALQVAAHLAGDPVLNACAFTEALDRAIVGTNKLGEALKRAGMERAAANRRELLALARGIADAAALRGDGTATADDVAEGLEAAGRDPADLGAAFGSIFKGKGWRFTGEWRPSRRPSNHARPVRVWRREPAP